MHRPRDLASPRARAAARFGALVVVFSTLLALSAWPWSASADTLPEPTAQTERLPWQSSARPGKGGGRFVRELGRRHDVARRAAGASPGAVLALTGVLGELLGEIDSDELTRFVAAIAGDRRRHPLVRSYADYLAARLLEHRGDIAGARERLVRGGYLVSWQIVGPFDNASRAGEAAVYEPEKIGFVPEAQMFGKLAGEAIGWRAWDYAGLPRGGYVALDDLLRPADQAVGYATAWVHVDRETDAALHLGTAGPYKVWIGDVLVGAGDAYRAPDPLQETHAIHLGRGWNRVLVKVATLEGMWGFYARISAPDGAPLAGMKASSEPPASVVAGRAATHEVASLRRGLERAAEKDRRGWARLDLVEFYRYVHPFDKDDKHAVELARRADADVASARSAFLLAILDPDSNGSRRALATAEKRAAKEGPKSRGLHGQILLELAWRERALGLETRYDELLEQAHAAAPDDAIIELALADRLAERELPWSALRWSEALAARYPASQTVQEAKASRLRGLGRLQAALGVLEHLVAAGRSDRSVLASRIDILLELGRADEATRLARNAADAMPGLPEAHAEVARLEQARGDLDLAAAAMARAVALAPQDAELHAELGRLLARSGSRTAAIASLRRSLALRPQQPQIRDLLASLDRSSQGDLLARYGVDLATVAKRDTPAAWKGVQAGVLHHRVAVKVLPNGLTERLDHRIIRVLDDRGIRSQAIQATGFDPAESTVEVRRARVHRADGSIEELGDQRMLSMASAGYRMYYDQRQLQVVFPGLRVGDTLEVAFVRRDIAARNMFDEYFGDIVPLSGTEPRAFVEYVLEAPAEKPIYFNVATTDTKSKDGKTRIYRHAQRDLPALKPENGMPGWSEVATYLHASTYRTWDEVGRWYWGLVEPQLVLDEAIRTAVADVLASLPKGADERTKVAAIYAHVVRNTRYVGLEFGIHGYKPYRTTDVYARRFGDCKDKASLLKVMLGEAGIASNLVLVRTRDQGTVPGKPASLAVFNHAITYVPSLGLYLDGTAEWSGPSELPAGDQGATVLLVEDGKGASLRTIPVSKASENRRVSSQVIAIDERGRARVGQKLVVEGVAAGALRYEFQSLGERVEKLQKAFGELYPGVRVDSVAAPRIGDILAPVELSAELDVPSWAPDVGDGRQRFRVLGRPSRTAQSMAPQDDRKFDLLLDAPSVEVHNITYQLPRGRRFSQLPSPRRVDGAFGRFDLEVVGTPNGAQVRTTIEIKRNRIGKAEYRAFREFLRQVDAGLEQTFTIEAER